HVFIGDMSLYKVFTRAGIGFGVDCPQEVKFMKYAPTIWDFQSGFFLIERAKEPYFLISKTGQVLRSNRVGARFLERLARTKPQALETLITTFNEMVSKPSKKALTQMIGEKRKRVLRATPVDSGEGYLVEIDRV